MAWMDALKKAMDPKSTAAATVQQQQGLPNLDPKKTPAAPQSWLGSLGQVAQKVAQPVVNMAQIQGQNLQRQAANPQGQPVTNTAVPVQTAQNTLQGQVEDEWMKRLRGEVSGQMRGFNAQNAQDVAGQQKSIAFQAQARGMSPAAIAHMQAQAGQQGANARTQFQSKLQEDSAQQAGQYVQAQQALAQQEAQRKQEWDLAQQALAQREAQRKQEWDLAQQEFQLNVQKFGEEQALARLKMEQDRIYREREQDQKESQGWMDLLASGAKAIAPAVAKFFGF